MQRAVFWLTALALVPIGLFFYFLPPDVAGKIGLGSAMWLARAFGALAVAWGIFLISSGFDPNRHSVTALASGNLLLVATLVPAVLRQGESMTPTLRLGMLVFSGVLLLLAALALLNQPRRYL